VQLCDHPSVSRLIRHRAGKRYPSTAHALLAWAIIKKHRDANTSPSPLLDVLQQAVRHLEQVGAMEAVDDLLGFEHSSLMQLLTNMSGEPPAPINLLDPFIRSPEFWVCRLPLTQAKHWHTWSRVHFDAKGDGFEVVCDEAAQKAMQALDAHCGKPCRMGRSGESPASIVEMASRAGCIDILHHYCKVQLKQLSVHATDDSVAQIDGILQLLAAMYQDARESLDDAQAACDVTLVEDTLTRVRDSDVEHPSWTDILHKWGEWVRTAWTTLPPSTSESFKAKEQGVDSSSDGNCGD
jgi:hypothetical protein